MATLSFFFSMILLQEKVSGRNKQKKSIRLCIVTGFQTLKLVNFPVFVKEILGEILNIKGFTTNP